MTDTTSFSLPELLVDLVDRRDLNEGRMQAFLTEVMAGRVGEAETAALLVALRMKGETAEETRCGRRGASRAHGPTGNGTSRCAGHLRYRR